MNRTALQDFLDQKTRQYNHWDFIEDDPISIPHRFSHLQDIEISGFFAAILSWGRRTTIINSCTKLLSMMDDSPYDFILHHRPADLKPFQSFVHRTFNATDALFFISILQNYYSTFVSLEYAFSTHIGPEDKNVKKSLIGFKEILFAGEFPLRTQKHLSSPARNSACKRLNLFLRWMVRHDLNGVDFGLWKNISPRQLIIPMDVHVSRVAKRLGLIDKNIVNWKNAELLTDELRKFDPQDPVKYDFALFGLGVIEQFV